MKTFFVLLATAFVFASPATAGRGSFTSNDPLLNRIWSASVKTAEDVVSPRTNLSPLGCPVPDLLLILDGKDRDRCPYISDIAVSGATLMAAGDDPSLVRSMLVMFASIQHDDGGIPASPLEGGWMVTNDYSAYWIDVLHQYVLQTGDIATASQLLPNVTRVLDQWYPARIQGGLVVNLIGNYDYGFIRHRGAAVSYYNNLYVWSLRKGAELAAWTGDSARAASWSGRATAMVPKIVAAFWDSSAGAFFDTTEDVRSHPQDGNAFAVLAGVASAGQAKSALGWLSDHNARGYGNTINDTQAWDDAAFGRETQLRVYPFMSYFEVEARFVAGLETSAIDLIRREWGYMLANGPGTMWESIGPYGSGPVGTPGSWDHGWSTGAAPAITHHVLGVQATSPGFATFTVTPHPGGVRSASGDVPTPKGVIHVVWAANDAGDVTSLKVTAPAGLTWTNAPATSSSKTVSSKKQRASTKPTKPTGVKR
ncbi:unannotated protein [freshwater metagenome]|uniref:Unannotated protein n=1 Tax=freshwater metagenome TaxID=449393 RepID=A0A6J6N600_9ZZZZ